MIGTAKRLDISNFRLGQRRDGALRDDALLSLRNLVNYDIIYEDGRLKCRYGYERWNSVELAAPCTQLYQFVDLEGNEHFLGILDTSTTDSFDQWYIIKESVDHVVLRAQGATARKAVMTYGNRCFFCTNSDLWWTDNTAITGGSSRSFPVGITRPNTIVSATPITTEGTYSSAAQDSSSPTLNATTVRKWASMFSVTRTQDVSTFRIAFNFATTSTTKEGAIRIALYPDDSGEPSDDMVDDYAYSNWVNCSAHGYNAGYDSGLFRLQRPVELTGGTDYWLVVEADDNYYANISEPAGFAVWFLVQTSPPANSCLRYNNATSAWVAFTKRVCFWIGGIYDAEDEDPFDGTAYFDYVVTYVNSTYGIESRPSDSARVGVTASDAGGVTPFTRPDAATVEITPTASTFNQVDTYRLYRRSVGNDPSVEDDSITDTYKLVAEVSDSVTVITDSFLDDDLGGVLQSDDHYRYSDLDDTGSGLRDAALVPYTMIEWKGRVWIGEENSNILYFSKVLEEDGATGLTGDNQPDHFPLENRLEMPVPSGIIGLAKLPDDTLAVYFSNESVWIVQGGDQPLNPPPDLSYRELLPNNGLFATGTLKQVTGGNIYLSREGLYRMSMLGLELLSETNQKILDDIENQYLDDAILTVNGTEIWLLLDTDNDGERESILILDLQRDLPTRQLRDRAWRTYRYDVALNDIVTRKQGSTYRGVMAADAENNYILALNTGYVDNLYPIEVEGETHDIEVAGMIAVTGVSIRANYVDVVSSYDLTITDSGDEPHRFSIIPAFQNDIRGHKAGTRIVTPNFVRLRWQTSHVRRDEIRGITIDYIVEEVP